jgi:hypothetical protein
VAARDMERRAVAMRRITDAFEQLAHALRILPEVQYRAHSYLLNVDWDEAAGNVESALGAVLNGFHSLADALDKDAPGLVTPYSEPEIAAVLVLRNARHHNHANKIRTLYTFLRQEPDGACVLVNFPSGEDDAFTSELYISWADLDLLLRMPDRETRIRMPVAKSVREYIRTDRFASHAARYDLAEGRVLLNVFPLIVNAAATVVPRIAHRVSPKSMEGETYLKHFGSVSKYRLGEHVVALQGRPRL